MKDFIKYSIRSISRKRFRTLLTIISIAIGVASVVLISSIGEIGRQAIGSELSALGCDGLVVGKANKNAASPLEEENLAAILDSEGVKSAAGINVEYTQLQMRSLTANGVVWGIDQNADAFISMEPMYGRMINRRDIESASRVCMVDQNVANAFYKRDNIVGKELLVSMDTGVQRFEIVGVVRSGGNLLQGLMSSYIPSFVYVPYTALQQLAMKDEFDQVFVEADAQTDTEIVGEQVIRSLEQQSGARNGYRAENISKQKDTLDRLLSTVTLILSLIAGVSLVVAGLGIMTVMLVCVNERTHEIGIKKSIGASRSVIMLEFLIEAFIITLAGSVAGAALGISLVAVGCLILHIEVSVSMVSVLTCILFSVLVGVIFGVYPASTAARMRPVDALRMM